ncbi:hypothetical protein TNCT_64141 [Trichonephila clavata]|uniref:RING-type domain-containing protein n=1 Tax=Trichonephila clavata TaxID=2740835 RepID=A0A8X6H3C3_TRICU|nr:hypothetical protein TNCT_64141 [Trichonephila clavata]
MYETRSVPKGDRGLVLWGLAGFGTMGDAGSYGSATLESAPFPDPVFGVPEKCPICLEPMHFPHTTECGHTFHKACLERTQSPTCPLCRQTV